jgi:hypothetical protein
MFRGRSGAVVGNVVFEMSHRQDTGTMLVAEPFGVRDPARGSDVRRSVVDLKRSAIRAAGSLRFGPA